MARHMTIEFPLLIVIGWLAAYLAGARLAHSMATWNTSGVPAMLAGFLITMFWMLPVSLDLAVLNPAAATLKVFSLVGTGLLVGASWRSSGLVVQTFFLLNLVWMMLTVGLLYQEAPQQLCSVYLGEEQAAAGMGMILLAVTLLALWLWQALRRLVLMDRLRLDDQS